MSLTAAAKCRLGRLYTKQTRRFFPPVRQSVVSGSGSMYSAAQILRDRRRKKPLLVLASAEEGARLVRSLEENDLTCTTFVLSTPRPTPEDIQAMGAVYRQEACDSMIALGGGAVMNAAKAAAAWIACPKALEGDRPYRRLLGGKCPTILTLPTAAGTGAESSFWAEVFDKAGNGRILAGRALTPAVTVLDPGLLEHTPRPEVAAAGLEGLCLAVEAYLTPGRGDKEAMMLAAEAVKGILTNLESCWNDGGTPVRRNALLEASQKAGLAASALGCGYIRTMCRTAISLGVDPAAAYGVVLPAVLEKYGSDAREKLSRLAAYSGVMTGGTQSERAAALIRRIRDMAFRMGLPDGLEGMNAEKIERMAFSAATDMRSLPPVYWTEDRCRRILENLCVSGDTNV